VTLRSGERLVVDASVAVKWVVPEADSERAELLLDHGLIAPDLLLPNAPTSSGRRCGEAN
jgi:predicted nucleic acid-binding protein